MSKTFEIKIEPYEYYNKYASQDYVLCGIRFDFFGNEKHSFRSECSNKCLSEIMSAIDDYFNGKPFNPQLKEELKKISHRQYTEGFYFGKPDNTAQVYTTNSYVRNYELIGTVVDYIKETKEVVIEQRNRFFKDDEIEILMPDEPFYTLKIEKIINEDNEEIEVAPHPQMQVRIPCEKEVRIGSFVRKEKLL